VIIFMGIAGSGKGTQSKLYADRDGYEVISTGELLRAYGSKEQQSRMLSGEILRDEEVTALLDKALGELPDPDKVLLDGYPRRISQADWLLKQQSQGRFTIQGILHLIATRETVKKRLEYRGRPDDHDHAIEERFSSYEKATLPILEYFAHAGVPIVEVDAERPIEEVHAAVMQAVKKMSI
jgi:adenylate kinase